MADCVPVVDESKFCCERKEPCSCGNNYMDCVRSAEGTTERWKTDQYLDTPDSEFGAGKYLGKVRDRVTKKVTAVYKASEAHHIVSCAGVSSEIQARADIRTIVMATNYCVNNGDNLVALPRFAHTLSWLVCSTEPG